MAKTLEINTGANIAGKAAWGIAHIASSVANRLTIPLDLGYSAIKTTIGGIGKLWAKAGTIVWTTAENIWRSLTLPFNNQVKAKDIWKKEKYQSPLANYKPMSHIKGRLKRSAQKLIAPISVVRDESKATKKTLTFD